MARSIASLLLSLLVALTGLTLADARGRSHDLGQEMVICSGVELITIVIGPDGEPVEKAEPCPDGTSIFAATFALPLLADPELRILALLVPLAPGALNARNELSPSARGPPALV